MSEKAVEGLERVGIEQDQPDQMAITLRCSQSTVQGAGEGAFVG